MFYTSYFGNLKSLPAHMIPISICGKAPEWYKGLQYKKLAPKWDFFKQWKEDHNNEEYIKQYKSQVLDNLHFWEVYDALYDLAQTKCNGQPYEICLICYEKPSDFCHRHLVADWFNANGILCLEWED